MFLRCVANPKERPSVDGDGDFVSIPTFNYADGARFSISMWANSDVCDSEDPSPSLWGYLYSHNQVSERVSILSGDNSNINIYQGCGVRGDSRQSAGMTTSSAGGGFMRFVFVGGSGYMLFDVPFSTLMERRPGAAMLEDVTFNQFGFTYAGTSLTVYVNGLQLQEYRECSNARLGRSGCCELSFVRES